MSRIQRAFWPRIEWREGGTEHARSVGARGQNNFFRIWTFTGIDTPIGTQAQEYAEWQWNHRRARLYAAIPIIGCLAAAFLVSWLFLMLAFICYQLGYLATNAQKAQSQTFGAAVTVVVSSFYGEVPFETILARQAASTAEKSQLRGKDTLTLIKAQLTAAERWFRDHRDLVESFRRFLAKA